MVFCNTTLFEENLQKKCVNLISNLTQQSSVKLVCTCHNKSIIRKSNEQDEKQALFYNIYRYNDTRCIICKTNIINFFPKYSCLTTTNSVRQEYHIDHIEPISDSKNDCIVHNKLIICHMCNSAKSTKNYAQYCVEYALLNFLFNEIKKLIEKKYIQYENLDEINQLYFDSIMKEKTFPNESEMISFIKTNKINFYYSDFLIYELTPNAKTMQLTEIKKYFVEKIGFEPINDLVFYNKDYYLSAYSTNLKYLYKDLKLENKYFRFINVILRLKNNTEIQQMNCEDLEEDLIYIASNKLTLNLSDFLMADYKYFNLGDLIKMIKIYDEVINEFEAKYLMHKINRNYDLSYSQFIDDNTSYEEKINILTNIKKVSLEFFGKEPINDLIINNNNIFASKLCKKINVELF